MTRLIAGCFSILGGVIGYFVAQMVVAVIPTEGWSSSSILLMTVLAPLAIIIGSIVSVFIGTTHFLSSRGRNRL